MARWSVPYGTLQSEKQGSFEDSVKVVREILSNGTTTSEDNMGTSTPLIVM